jgi:hypothetical protein
VDPAGLATRRARRSRAIQPADQVTSAAATMSMRDGSMYCIDM